MEINSEVKELLLNKGFEVVEDTEDACCLRRDLEYFRAMRSSVEGVNVFTYSNDMRFVIHGSDVSVDRGSIVFTDNGYYVGYAKVI